MKIFRFLAVLSAGIMLSSCGDEGRGDNDAIGSVVFDGKGIAMKASIFEENTTTRDLRALYERWNIEYRDDKEYMIGVTTYQGTSGDMDNVTSFYFTSPLPQIDFDLDLASSSAWLSRRAYFLSGGKLYISRLMAVVPQAESRMSSIGIDPETGEEYYIDHPPYNDGAGFTDIPDLGTITGGHVSVRWKSETLRLDFNLKLDDGKTAKGYGEIPREIIVL